MFDNELQDDASSTCSLEDYTGDIDLFDAEPEHVEGGSAPPPGVSGGTAGISGSTMKMFHLSPEWQELVAQGEYLVRIPPLQGCGVNRHPAGNFWSCRFPGSGIKTASWGSHRKEMPDSMLKALYPMLC